MAAFVVLAGIYGFVIEPSRLVVRRERLVLERWPAELSGIRVAVVSDIHAGAPYINEKKLLRIVHDVNAAHPDAVLLLGDFMTMGVAFGNRMPLDTLTRALSQLQAPAFAVLGNHDGWLDREVVSEALVRAGITVLRNESTALELRGRSVSLFGAADVMTDKPDLSPIAATPPPLIVMTHSPDIFPKIRTPVVLTVAGHTHGGQVRLPLVGALFVPSVYGQRYARGHHVERGQHLFVTTGIGTSILPIRIGVVPEIMVLELVSPAPRPSPSRSPRPRP